MIRRLVAGVAATLLVGCSTQKTAAPGPLVGAEPEQFAPALSVSVSSGSFGVEGVGAGAHWWLSSPIAGLRISNNQPVPRRLIVTAKLFPPPCPGSTATATAALPRAEGIRIDIGAAGAELSLHVAVGAKSSVQASILTLSAPCRIATDPRALYLLLRDLAVRLDGDVP